MHCHRRLKVSVQSPLELVQSLLFAHTSTSKTIIRYKDISDPSVASRMKPRLSGDLGWLVCRCSNVVLKQTLSSMLEDIPQHKPA